MKILITGGLGNLGLWLTHYFLDEGHDVTVIGRAERVIITHPNYRFLAVDITKLKSLFTIIDCYYDACIHTASYNEHFKDNYSEQALKINSLGTENLCQSLLVYGVGKLVYLSTFHVYGISQGLVTEKSPVAPLNDYGLTHYFAEKYIEKNARINNLNYVIFRLTNSYGCPKDINTDKWYLVLNDLCRQAYENKKIQLNSNGKSLRDFIWMQDVVKVIDLSITSSKCVNTLFNLSAGISLNILDVADRVNRAYFKLFKDVIPIAVNLQDKTEPKSLSVSNEKLCRVMKYHFKDSFFEESVNILSFLNGK